MKKDNFSMRPITEADIPDLMPIFEEYFKAVLKKYEVYCPRTAFVVVREWISDTNSQIFLVEENEEVLGVGGVLLSTSQYNFGQSVGYEIMWYAKKSLSHWKRVRVFRLIFEAIEVIGETFKIDIMKFLIPIDSSVCKFLAKRGFEKSEVVMVRSEK